MGADEQGEVVERTMVVVGVIAGPSFDVVTVIGLAISDLRFGIVIVASMREGTKDASGQSTFSNHDNIADSQAHDYWPLRDDEVKCLFSEWTTDQI